MACRAGGRARYAPSILGGRGTLGGYAPALGTAGRLTETFFYEDGASDDFASETSGLIHQVMVEDITLCESVQRGMRTGTFEHGRLMLRYEHAIRHFQDLVRESLAA